MRAGVIAEFAKSNNTLFTQNQTHKGRGGKDVCYTLNTIYRVSKAVNSPTDRSEDH